MWFTEALLKKLKYKYYALGFRAEKYICEKANAMGKN